MKVYKYRSTENKEIFNRDINSFKSNQFYAATLNTVNDKFEGNFDEMITHSIDLVNQMSNVDTKTIKENLEELISYKEKIGIFCVSKNCLSETLWAYYSDNNKGYCVEYELDRLTDKLINHDFSLNLKVKYSSKKSVITIEDIQNNKIIRKMFATKKKRWQHEEEIRLIFDNFGLKNHHQSAISGIYFGCDATDETIKIVKNEFKDRDISFYKITVNIETNKLEKKLIDRHYKKLNHSLQDFNYELVKTVESTAISYYLFIKENYSLEELEELALAFKEKHFYKPSNLYFINNLEILPLIEIYPKTNEEYIKFADGIIADFAHSDNPIICEYPFRDFWYTTLKEK